MCPHVCYWFPLIGVDFKIKTVELRGKKIRLQIWWVIEQKSPVPLLLCMVHFLCLSLTLQAALTKTTGGLLMPLSFVQPVMHVQKILLKNDVIACFVNINMPWSIFIQSPIWKTCGSSGNITFSFMWSTHDHSYSPCCLKLAITYNKIMLLLQ